MITSNYGKRLGFLFFCLAFTLTMCGAASAAPTNSTHINLNQSVNNTATSLNTTANTKLPDPQVYNGHTYVGTYTTIADAINAAKSGDTIIIANGATFDEHGLTISKNLNFNVLNNGKATMNAQGKGQIFFIVGGVNVELENLILENGKATDGGSIGNVGVLTVKDCTFNGNTATSDGGAISNDGVLTVNDSIFNGNTAANDGGAIYNLPMGFSVTGSTFTGNSANEGGAIYNTGGASNYPVTISSNTFKTNSAKEVGGAIYNNGNLTVNSNTFTGNSAISYESCGGAIYNDSDGTLKVNNTSFKSNTAEGAGAAIFNGGNLTVTGCTFRVNNATNAGNGGAISNGGNLTVTSSTFTNNNAGSGGAIFNGFNNNLTITDSTFTNNNAEYGGAICNYGTATVHFNRIVGNTATYGGAIYNYAGKVDTTLNWWGYNTQASVVKQIVNINGGTVTYNPWIILTMTASPASVSIGKISTITAELLYSSNGVYHNPAKGLVPYTGYADFKTIKGTIINVKFVNGKASSTLTNLNTAELATVSATVDGKTVSANVKVTGVTISQLISAAASVKASYETIPVLPSSVSISGQTITMPQFLQLLVTGTININNGDLNPLTLFTVNSTSNPVGSWISGNIYKSEYLTIAQSIKNYITANGKAPNNANTSLGTIPFSKLVYSYSKIINYYGLNQELPNYVSVTVIQ